MLKFLWILLISSFSMATELPARCYSEAVRVIERPFSAGKFEYRFGVSTRENADAPMIIFVPGGPGQTSMDMPLAYSNDFAVVRTDPRGVGCNESNALTTADFTSYEIALDILAVVRELKPKRYFLHGISYGTIPATIAASLAEKENLPLPEAVILEGTIGKAYEKDEYNQGILNAWKDEKKKLPKNVIDQLSSSKLPFNYSSRDWATYLSTALIFGVLPYSGKTYFEETLPYLISDKRDYLELHMKTFLLPPNENRKEVYKAIACREFVPDVRDVKYDYDLVNGDLVVTDKKLCEGIPFDRPYDSKNYQVKSPIYYFSGNLDPVTSRQQALHHFNSQNVKRTFVSLERGGHQTLSGNLMDCFENIWLSILNSSDLAKSLSQCLLKKDIKIQMKVGEAASL